jgi:4,5-DOPA dioxygenase extradiol
MTSLPGLFISHGAPTLAIEANPTSAFLRQLSAQFARPEAILCISAHWETQRPALSTARHPQTIHDFYGFPPELYHLTYPAPGSPQLAEQAADLLQKAGIEAKLDPLQGFDHGAWEPLMLMYPEADIPVVQLSVQPHLDPHHHFQMGQALAPLRHEGILILGSGSATHNLRELRGRNVASSPPDGCCYPRRH